MATEKSVYGGEELCDQVSSLSLDRERSAKCESFVGMLATNYCLAKDDITVSFHLRAVNGVLANLLSDGKFAIGQMVEIHWTIFHDYSKFRLALAPNGAFDYGKGLIYWVNMFQDHVFVELVDAKRWIRHLLKEFLSVHFEGVDEHMENRIYCAIQLMYNSAFVLGRVRWVGESLGDGGEVLSGCNEGEFRVYLIFMEWLSGTQPDVKDFGLLQVAVGKVRYLYPVDLVMYIFELMYRMKNFVVLRKCLNDMSKVYGVVGEVLDYFSGNGNDKIVRTFAQMYRGQKYAVIPGMCEVKDRFRSLVFSFKG